MKLICISIIIVLFAGACKKEENKTWFEIRDQVTNDPIQGATVYIYKCNQYTDPFCGLIAWQHNTTDKNGRCGFESKDFEIVTFAEVAKNNYWGSPRSKNTQVKLFPFGWVRLRVTGGAAYPPSSRLSLIATGIDLTYIANAELNASADSSILLRCFGGQVNRVTWRVQGPSGTTLNSGAWNQTVPRLDTVAATLAY